MLNDILIGGVSSKKLFKCHQHLSLEVVKQRMVLTSAAFEATLDILVPGKVLCRMIWSKTMVAISGVSSNVISLVCCHRFEVIAVEQLVLGFADWTRREFGWLLVRFRLTL
jgi:hypothetical protein